MEIGPMDAYELMDKYKRAKNNYFDLENIEYDSDDTLVFEYEYPFSIELANTYEKKWSSDTFRCVNLELKDHFIDAICAEANNYYYPEDFVVAKKRNNIKLKDKYLVKNTKYKMVYFINGYVYSKEYINLVKDWIENDALKVWK